MNVLIVAASRHGSTAEIAEAIGDRLRERGFTADVADATHESISLDGYDIVIVGSAVYAGTWLKSAHKFVDRNATDLTTRRVWLFSSGPLDARDKDFVREEEVLGLISRTAARGHHLFAGRLESGDLNLAERVVAKIVRAHDGDYRDWSDVKAWADRVADAAASAPATAPAQAPASAPAHEVRDSPDS